MFLRRTLLGLFASATLALAADPGLLQLLMRDPKMVAGIDIERARDSAFGRRLVAEIRDDDKHFQQFLAETGFDPRRDLREVVLAGSNQQKPEESLVLVRGSFNTARIAAYARAQGAVPSSYRNFEIWKPGEKNNDGVFAFLDASVAVLGREDTVKAAIDRKLASSGGLNAELARNVDDWSGRYDAWIVSNEPIAGFGPFPNRGGSPGGLNVDSIRAASAGVRFGANIDIAAEATMRSPEDATALSDVIRFLTGMIRLNQNPQNQPPRPVLNLLDSLQVSVAGNVLTLQMTVPEEDLDRLMERRVTAKPAPRAKSK